MASDGRSVQIPAASLVHGSQAPTVKFPQSGKALPQGGNAAATQAAATAAAASASNESASAAVVAAQAKTPVAAQVAVLNKYFNDSGRSAQFRASEDEKNIQEVNPATGKVIAEYSASEFAALARSVGISGSLVDEHV